MCIFATLGVSSCFWAMGMIIFVSCLWNYFVYFKTSLCALSTRVWCILINYLYLLLKIKDFVGFSGGYDGKASSEEHNFAP